VVPSLHELRGSRGVIYIPSQPASSDTRPSGGGNQVAQADVDFAVNLLNNGASPEEVRGKLTCHLAVVGCTFRFNDGGRGGAIANGNGGGNAPVLWVDNCGFYKNKASDGAGIDNYDNGSMTVLWSAFGDNVAGVGGGAISYDVFSTATVESCRLTHNSAAYGDGILQRRRSESRLQRVFVAYAGQPR
jgi:hypothetical protein